MSASLALMISVSVFLAVGVPVAFALALATAVALALTDSYPLFVLMKETFSGIDSFPLMAVPFFVLAAELMTSGSLTDSLLRFVAQFVGHKRGGMGYANVGSLTFIAGISGSALAEAAGPGAMLIRMMEKSGYDKPYAAALTACTSIVGPIIPPSIIMIVYALQDDRVSVGALFAAGILPGLMIAAAMCVVNWHVSRQRGYRGEGSLPAWRVIATNTWRALPALALPIVILGGMRAGLFTPTEASVVAVFYALFCGRYVYKTLAWRAVPGIVAHSALVTASVLLIIGFSAAFTWILTIEGVPQAAAEWIGGLHLSPWSFLILLNVLLLAVGIFIEPLPAVMVMVPVIAPVAAKLGIDPIHLAMIVIYNLTLGMITPPVGGLLFVTCNVAKVSLAALTRELKPFLLAHGVMLLVLTAWPGLSTWAPKALGFL
jgi:C4-dicarboxylate transporter, DctM subunit